MACPAVLTGEAFLTRVVANIDCQARTVGSLGWEALAQPGALATAVLASLLTIFVALFGIRLLFGPAPGAREIVTEVLKIGIVLTLALSWPAFRTLLHDVVLDGPGELATALSAPVTGEARGSLLAQLQYADDAMLRLTEAGTGRQTGAFVNAEDPGGTFRASALEDESTFGSARLVWLAGIVGSLALLRLTGGLLLALAPLAAGLLLFEATRGLFAGWLRGLVLALIGTVGVSLVLAVEAAVLIPWLEDALRVRSLGYATPAAPTELFALTLAFALAKFGTVAWLARVAFTRGWVTVPRWERESRSVIDQRGAPSPAPAQVIELPTRAARIVQSVETQLRYEEGAGGRTSYAYRLGQPSGGSSGSAPGSTMPASLAAGPEPLGRSWRRSAIRGSQTARARDARP
ncbi:type IV secretion system protein [Porphyrobacter sp. GA68]|uniref:type IV secretion system protein n=1 Tax=Porphyrobacter sp. GA68 TaxID=2883480 RepID=UPI001D18A86F|nr:type IV secretion system protein [Porphyrobacter sp. GA68]